MIFIQINCFAPNFIPWPGKFFSWQKFDCALRMINFIKTSQNNVFLTILVGRVQANSSDLTKNEQTQSKTVLWSQVQITSKRVTDKIL